MIESICISAKYREVEVKVIRHRNADEMREELKGEYLDHKGTIIFEQDMEMVHGFTVGEYIEGRPLISVFIPAGYSASEYHEIISHEATHIALGIVRNETYEVMFAERPVHISMDTKDPSAIYEEPVAIMIGELTRMIHELVDSLDASTRKVAFAKGIEWRGRDT